MSLSALLVNRCTIKRPIRTNSSGVSKTTWQTIGTGIPCNLQERPGTFRNMLTGQAAEYDATLYLPASTDLSPVGNSDDQDQVTMEDGAGTVFVVISVVDSAGRSNHRKALLRRYSGGTSTAFNLLNGLGAYWRLNETSGTRADAVGNCHLSQANNPSYAAGKFGNAAAFVSASNQYLQCVSGASILANGANPWTVACWVWFDALTNASGTDQVGFVSKGDGGTTYAWALFLRPSAGVIEFSTYDNAGHTARSTSLNNPAIATGRWYHVIAEHDAEAETIRLFVDLIQNDIRPTSSYGVPYDSGYRLNVGRAFDGNPYNFSGRVDALGFWSRLLTDAEKFALYNRGAGLEYPF